MDNKLWENEGLTEKEYQMIVDILDREPNRAELGMYGVMWSEHCSYKNSKKVLNKLPTRGEQVIQGPGENAGIIDIGDGQAVSFKIESHNHPSAIEPYQGAATGIGGIIRDIFTMGARPIACLNSLRFGDIEDDHVQFLFDGVVEGIAGYGNCIGIPNVGGEVFFSEAYGGNPLVNAMCVGLMDQENISTGTASGVGNPVMVVGAATGRDGIQGASFASDELTDESEEDRPAVQVGDPFMEKLLLEASLELIETGALVGIQDMGAAGLTSSSCEMASRGNSGIELDVSLVPKREKGMTPYEVLLSESQERMLVVPKKGKEDLVKKIFNKWGLNAAVIGKVTSDGQLRIMNDDKVVAEVPAASLADDAPTYDRESIKPSYIDEKNKFDPLEEISEDNLVSKKMSGIDENKTEEKSKNNYNKLLLDLLTAPNIASKEWVFQQYDYVVRNNTVVIPGSDAAVLRIKGTKKGLALTTDCNARYCYLDPQKGGKIAVAEAARNIVCSGARPLAITDGLNFGNPLNPEIFWQFEQCIEGISEACNVLDTPVTGGNVSFYNESPVGSVYPTPIIGMVGLLNDVSNVVTQDFKDEGDLILLLGETRPELGGSEYLNHFYDIIAGEVPDIDLTQEKKVQAVCLTAAEKGIIKSAHDCSEGGLAVNLAESCITGEVGAEINDSIFTSLTKNNEKVSHLFSETQSRIVISIDPEDLDQIKQLTAEYDIKLTELGRVTGENLTISRLIDLSIKELRDRWKNAISSHMEK